METTLVWWNLCARLLMGWALSERPDADLLVKALDMAYEQRGRSQGDFKHFAQPINRFMDA
jgi:putative transposase